MKMAQIKYLGYILLCLLMQGCIPGLSEDGNLKERVELPRKFPTVDSTETLTSKNKKGGGGETAYQAWAEFFIDGKLKKLISIALQNNQELKILEQEVQIAHNEIMARKGEYLPKVWGGASYEIEKVGEFTSQGASDATTQYEPGKFVPKVLHNHRAGLFTAWEIDVWKKLRNATRSAYYRYLATIDVQKFMVTNLVAEVANTYYELKALDTQLEIVQRYIKNLQRAQQVVEAQKSAARTTSLAVKRFKAEVLKNQARIYKIKQSVIAHENKINFLVGRFPQAVVRSKISLTDLTPKHFSTGVPFQLLDNRPDVQKAYHDLEASHIDVKVAKASFFPSLGIDGGVGYEAFDASHFIITPESVFYNLAARLAVPILNRNAIKAAYFSANNKQIQAIYSYNLVILSAFKEIADQLAAIANLNKIYRLRQRQVSALTESVDISNMLFRAARVDYLESLLTQRDLLEAQIELVEIKKERLTSYVMLYKSLGGGWRANPQVKDKG